MTIPTIPDPNAPGEPAAFIGLIMTALAAALAALVAFGLPVTGDQQAALLSVLATLGPIATAVWVRFRVYSPATVRTMLVDAGRARR